MPIKFGTNERHGPSLARKSLAPGIYPGIDRNFFSVDFRDEGETLFNIAGFIVAACRPRINMQIIAFNRNSALAFQVIDRATLLTFDRPIRGGRGGEGSRVSKA